MANDVEIAWCAGFFDGEGHVSYYRSYPHIITGRVTGAMRCNVPQASDNIETLERFQRAVGLGKIKGPYPMPNSTRTQHKLQFGVKEVETLFLTLSPYLMSEKSNDFRNALMAYWTHNPHPTAEDYARLRAKNDKKRMKWEAKNGENKSES